MSFRLILMPLAALVFIECLPARGCSECACGDKAFIMSQLDSAFAHRQTQERFALTLQNYMSNKSNALSADEGIGTESERDIRPTVRIGFRATNRIGLAAELPYVFKKMQRSSQMGPAIERSAGIGDALLSTTWTDESW